MIGTSGTRAYPTRWGAMEDADGTGRFRLWAPSVEAVSLRLAGEDHPMAAAGDGWFTLHLPATPGAGYAFVLPDGTAVPDPAARAQMGDVHGPSRLVDPHAYRWRTPWAGRPWHEAVIYELHLGTFTPEGTFAAARERLAYLAETGITAVELMPVAQFEGTRSWGYDGVLLYAPDPSYGPPEEMKAFIDAAHAYGLMVLLDVVYNHFGPAGNYLNLYARDFFDTTRQTPWGEAIAFQERAVRDFVVDNALYWLVEYNLDGLRLDAIDHVQDPSEPEILVEIAERVRSEITDRPAHLTTEDERNITRLHERGPDGEVRLYTAEWNDDFHHLAHVVGTGETEGYYADYYAHPWPLFGQLLTEGFAYQGEVSAQSGLPRGVPSAHQPPTAFIDFLQNHDQSGNRAFGERLTTMVDPAMLRALTAMLLLSPHIPLLFMGEEYGEERPFLFFTDFHGELADLVRQGRREEFAEFAAFQQGGHTVEEIPDPNAESTFRAAKLDWNRAARPEGQAARDEVRHLLDLRQRHIVPHLVGVSTGSGSVLKAEAGLLAVDWRLSGATLQLRANLGRTEAAVPTATGDCLFAAPRQGLAPAAPLSVAVYLATPA